MNHEKMMRIIHDVFHPTLPRLAPGDEASTRRALDALFGNGLGLPAADFQVLDMGCGNGSQTLSLARELGCRITAVDNHQPYLDELDRRAAEAGFGHLITTHCEDMNTFDPGDQRFDLVWAEGSAFVMGVPEALKAWRGYLKPGGALGFTDLAWFRDDAPAECRDFFAAIYPQMPTREFLLETVEECGFELVGHFNLPESSWWEPFYEPLGKRLETYPEPEDAEEREVFRMIQQEIVNYRLYSSYFGYVFFLLRLAG
jgi:cyclopropane fatty-acyl-phospholipid synthase-like methyltransferase